MLIFLNWVTVALSLILLYKSTKRILIGRYSILHLCVVVLWVMQVLPLLVENVIGVDDYMKNYPNMYQAMTDETVGIIYCILIFATMFVLYLLANRAFCKSAHRYSLRKMFLGVRQGPVVQLLLLGGMFLPVIAVLFSPAPQIYLQFSYFYTHEYATTGAPRAFHTDVMTLVNYVAFGATMLRYLYKDNSKGGNNVDVMLAIFLYNWIDGKRALLTFSLLGILAIDILKQSYVAHRRKLLRKACIFAVIVFGYFIIYSQLTGKADDLDFWVQYTFYYSRLSCVKTAIYDVLYTNRMLDYNGQTLLFDILFFVPRAFWPDKPVMFCKYFTAYVYNYAGGFLSWNLHVNIWTEFIANLGLLGQVIAVAVVAVAARITENSKQLFVYLFGTVFIVFYFMFGFETLTMIAYVLWIAGILWSILKRVLARIKR